MDEQRAEFEAWASHFFFRGELDRHGINGARPDEYRVLHIERMWGAWQAATQRQRERISALEAQVQALSMDAGRLRTSQSRTGYMCLTDFQHELGEASGGISVYADEDDLKKHRNCWKGCGILKVEVVAAIARATHKEQT